MADQTPDEIIDAETDRIESALNDSLDSSVAPYDSLNDLVDTYDGLELGDDDYLNGGPEYGFLRLTCDEEVAIPDMLPSIKHGNIVFFLVSMKIDWPPHIQRNILSFLPRGILDQGTLFIPEENRDVLLTFRNYSAELIEALTDYLSFVAEVTQYRADLKAGHKDADQVTAEMHQLQKQFIENKS